MMVAVAALMVCSFCGAVCEADYFPHFGEGLKEVVEFNTPFSGGTTPDDGIPGGPPGSPG